MPSVRRIRLRRNAIRSTRGHTVGAFLVLSPVVETMDIGLNDIKAGGGDPTAAIADALARNSVLTITTLVMDRCALGPDGATRLTDALAVNASLATLELEGKMISPRGGGSACFAPWIRTRPWIGRD